MKELCKKVLRAAARLLVLPFYLLYRLESIFLSTQRAFQGYSHFFSLIPGIVGEYLRREFYILTTTSCASDCCISFGTIFSNPDVVIGSRAYIGHYCVIGRARIGRDTMIASRVSVISGLMQHGTARLDVPMRDQAGTLEVVSISEDCWIGEGAIVAADIGGHSIVSVGAIVKKAIPASSVVSGTTGEVRERR